MSNYQITGQVQQDVFVPDGPSTWSKIGNWIGKAATQVGQFAGDVARSAGPVLQDMAQQGFFDTPRSYGGGSTSRSGPVVLDEPSATWSDIPNLPGSGTFQDLGAGMSWNYTQNTGGYKRHGSASDSKNLRAVQKQLRSKADRLKPPNLPEAVTRDKYNNVTNLWHKLEAGNPLDPREVEQLDLSLTVAEHQAETIGQAFEVDRARQYAKAKQVEVNQQFIDDPSSAQLDRLYEQVKHNQELLRERIKRHQEIIRESKNAGANDLLDYWRFMHSFNFMSGAKSNEAPISSNSPNNLEYLWHGYTGQGQDISTDIKNIELPVEAIKKGLISLPQVNVAILKSYAHGNEQTIHVDTVLFQTSWKQAGSIGKVKLQVDGHVYKTSSGLHFKGVLKQGNNAEVYIFPVGSKRSLGAEALTFLGRYSILPSPITVFRTIITGERHVDFPLIQLPEMHQVIIEKDN